VTGVTGEPTQEAGCVQALEMRTGWVSGFMSRRPLAGAGRRGASNFLAWLAAQAVLSEGIASPNVPCGRDHPLKCLTLAHDPNWSCSLLV